MSSLPSGWMMVIDQKTGRPYYFNIKTRETTWTNPNESLESKKLDKESLKDEDSKLNSPRGEEKNTGTSSSSSKNAITTVNLPSGTLGKVESPKNLKTLQEEEKQAAIRFIAVHSPEDVALHIKNLEDRVKKQKLSLEEKKNSLASAVRTVAVLDLSKVKKEKARCKSLEVAVKQAEKRRKESKSQCLEILRKMQEKLLRKHGIILRQIAEKDSKIYAMKQEYQLRMTEAWQHPLQAELQQRTNAVKAALEVLRLVENGGEELQQAENAARLGMEKSRLKKQSEAHIYLRKMVRDAKAAILSKVHFHHQKKKLAEKQDLMKSSSKNENVGSTEGAPAISVLDAAVFDPFNRKVKRQMHKGIHIDDENFNALQVSLDNLNEIEKQIQNARKERRWHEELKIARTSGMQNEEVEKKEENETLNTGVETHDPFSTILEADLESRVHIARSWTQRHFALTSRTLEISVDIHRGIFHGALQKVFSHNHSYPLRDVRAALAIHAGGKYKGKAFQGGRVFVFFDGEHDHCVRAKSSAIAKRWVEAINEARKMLEEQDTLNKDNEETLQGDKNKAYSKTALMRIVKESDKQLEVQIKECKVEHANMLVDLRQLSSDAIWLVGHWPSSSNDNVKTSGSNENVKTSDSNDNMKTLESNDNMKTLGSNDNMKTSGMKQTDEMVIGSSSSSEYSDSDDIPIGVTGEPLRVYASKQERVMHGLRVLGKVKEYQEDREHFKEIWNEQHMHHHKHHHHHTDKDHNEKDQQAHQLIASNVVDNAKVKDSIQKSKKRKKSKSEKKRKSLRKLLSRRFRSKLHANTFGLEVSNDHETFVEVMDHLHVLDEAVEAGLRGARGMWLVCSLMLLAPSMAFFQLRRRYQMEVLADKKKQNSNLPHEWSAARVEEWLRSEVNIPECAGAFRREDVDGAMLLQLDEDMLTELGIEDKKVRKKIQRERTKLIKKSKFKQLKSEVGNRNRVRFVDAILVNEVVGHMLKMKDKNVTDEEKADIYPRANAASHELVAALENALERRRSMDLTVLPPKKGPYQTVVQLHQRVQELETLVAQGSEALENAAGPRWTDADDSRRQAKMDKLEGELSVAKKERADLKAELESGHAAQDAEILKYKRAAEEAETKLEEFRANLDIKKIAEHSAELQQLRMTEARLKESQEKARQLSEQLQKLADEKVNNARNKLVREKAAKKPGGAPSKEVRKKKQFLCWRTQLWWRVEHRLAAAAMLTRLLLTARRHRHRRIATKILAISYIHLEAKVRRNRKFARKLFAFSALPLFFRRRANISRAGKLWMLSFSSNAICSHSKMHLCYTLAAIGSFALLRMERKKYMNSGKNLSYRRRGIGQTKPKKRSKPKYGLVIPKAHFTVSYTLAENSMWKFMTRWQKAFTYGKAVVRARKEEKQLEKEESVIEKEAKEVFSDFVNVFTSRPIPRKKHKKNKHGTDSKSGIFMFKFTHLASGFATKLNLVVNKLSKSFPNMSDLFSAINSLNLSLVTEEHAEIIHDLFGINGDGTDLQNALSECFHILGVLRKTAQGIDIEEEKRQRDMIALVSMSKGKGDEGISASVEAMLRAKREAENSKLSGKDEVPCPFADLAECKDLHDMVNSSIGHVGVKMDLISIFLCKMLISLDPEAAKHANNAASLAKFKRRLSLIRTFYELPRLVKSLEEKLEMLKLCCEEVVEATLLPSFLRLVCKLTNAMRGVAKKPLLHAIDIADIDNVLFQSRTQHPYNEKKPLCYYVIKKLSENKKYQDLLNFTNELKHVKNMCKSGFDSVLRSEIKRFSRELSKIKMTFSALEKHGDLSWKEHLSPILDQLEKNEKEIKEKNDEAEKMYTKLCLTYCYDPIHPNHSLVGGVQKEPNPGAPVKSAMKEDIFFILHNMITKFVALKLKYEHDKEVLRRAQFRKLDQEKKERRLKRQERRASKKLEKARTKKLKIAKEGMKEMGKGYGLLGRGKLDHEDGSEKEQEREGGRDSGYTAGIESNHFQSDSGESHDESVHGSQG
eukprot:g5486.t1